MKYSNIREEEVKNRVGQDFFEKFDTTGILENIDFSVRFCNNSGVTLLGDEYLLWAEAKDGCSDIYASFAQLILTIGQSGTVKNHLPPPFLGAFDSRKIAFVPYIDIADVFTINDFNWKVAPSNHKTKEFRLLYDRVQKIIDERMYLYDFVKDETELRHFINNNLPAGRASGKVQITKNNFIHIYLRWLEEVKPHINFNWDEGKKGGILNCDFYRADLFVDDKSTEDIEDDTAIADNLSVIFRGGKYHIISKVWGSDVAVAFDFHQGGRRAYTAFWKKYKRPPLKEYWEYIIERRDLLVPQDVRERKGSFFTPKIWVELSQKYLADVLGEDWQDEYYVWDCAAGTGNLLTGLTNKYNIWASTLDKADVDVMKDRIRNGANLLEDHVFQFDFLNDEFTKLPRGLQNIIDDPEKRKKLVIYINPPYAEHGNRTTFAGEGQHKASVATETKVYNDFNKTVGTATRELYAQFFLRVYKDIPNVIFASFSTAKFINAQNFSKFRNYFKAQFLRGFICQANTFDNVNGKFPIGFFIWNLQNTEDISCVTVDIVYHEISSGETKSFYAINDKTFISDWLRVFYDKLSNKIGYLVLPGVDMQQQNGVYITSKPTESDILQHKTTGITKNNLIEMSIYLTVRQCIEPTWINNRDQFLYPNDGWKTDREFQNDCLAYTLFNNNIRSAYGVNHWIPFTEAEVDSRDKFESNFMTDFMAGKIEPEQTADLFSDCRQERRKTALMFSAEAQAVFDAGRKLWKYYHAQPKCNVNASLYDIREHFQGRNDKGKMNNKSTDERYGEIIGSLRTALKALAKKIEPKVYEYGFLKE